MAAPVGSGKAAAETAWVAGKFDTLTAPETAWVAGKLPTVTLGLPVTLTGTVDWSLASVTARLCAMGFWPTVSLATNRLVIAIRLKLPVSALAAASPMAPMVASAPSLAVTPIDEPPKEMEPDTGRGCAALTNCEVPSGLAKATAVAGT